MKSFDYLATIKRNHKVCCLHDEKEGDTSFDVFWRHIRSLKNANRLSGFALIQPYSTAIHSFYTGILFEEIAIIENIYVTINEIGFVYRHDIVESVTGDVLLPVKIHSETTNKKWKEIEEELIDSRYSALRNYSDQYAEHFFSEPAFRLFKACDLFELYFFIMEEMELGNMSQGIVEVLMNCRNLLPEFNIDFITKYVNPMG